jgi:hypothetical protein
MSQVALSHDRSDNVVGRFCGPVLRTLACRVTPLPSHLVVGLSDKIFRDESSDLIRYLRFTHTNMCFVSVETS